MALCHNKKVVHDYNIYSDVAEIQTAIATKISYASIYYMNKKTGSQGNSQRLRKHTKHILQKSS